MWINYTQLLYTEKKENTIWFANIGDTKELKTEIA